MKCGCEAGTEMVCPACGQDLSIQAKTMNISNLYYNMGLDRAQIRDLSGAIGMLERSIKYNKLNINARNLLGLVYLEVGEVVSALSEWIISKNIKPEHNIASEFIAKVRANTTRLDVIHKSIKRYNRALDVSRSGEDDIAIVMLRKVLSSNPKLIKAYHLLALLYMKNGEYAKARKILKKAMQIDRTNVTSIRFLKETDSMLDIPDSGANVYPGMENKDKKGVKKVMESAASIFKKQDANQGYTAVNWDDEEKIVSAPVIQPIAVRQLPAYMSLINIIIGIVIGAFVIGLIVVPAVKSSVNREAENRVAQYTGTLVTQNDAISRLEAELKAQRETIGNTNDQVARSSQSVASYEALLNAYMAYSGNDFDRAKEYIALVNRDLLSDDARAVYDSISINVTEKRFAELYNSGIDAFNNGDFALAAASFARAREYKNDNFNALAYMAHAYRLSGQTEAAYAAFQEMADKYPGTEIASSASRYMERLRQGDICPEIGAAAAGAEVASLAAIAGAS